MRPLFLAMFLLVGCATTQPPTVVVDPFADEPKDPPANWVYVPTPPQIPDPPENRPPAPPPPPLICEEWYVNGVRHIECHNGPS